MHVIHVQKPNGKEQPSLYVVFRPEKLLRLEAPQHPHEDANPDTDNADGHDAREYVQAITFEDVAHDTSCCDLSRCCQRTNYDIKVEKRWRPVHTRAVLGKTKDHQVIWKGILLPGRVYFQREPTQTMKNHMARPQSQRLTRTQTTLMIAAT